MAICIDTEKQLFELIKKYELGYIIRNYKLSDELIKQIANDEYSSTVEDSYITEQDIYYFQNMLEKKNNKKK